MGIDLFSESVKAFEDDNPNKKVLIVDKTYNGWSNYETWSIALFIDNDESLYIRKEEVKEQILRDCLTNVSYEFSGWLKDFTYEFLEVDKLNLYQQQLILSALGEVDFIEIANAYLEE